MRTTRWMGTIAACVACGWLGAVDLRAAEPVTQQRVLTHAAAELGSSSSAFHGWHRAWYYGSNPYGYYSYRGYGSGYGYVYARPSLYVSCNGCYGAGNYAPYVYSGYAVAPYYRPYYYSGYVQPTYYTSYDARPYYTYPMGHYRYGYYAYPSYYAFAYPYSYRGLYYGAW